MFAVIGITGNVGGAIANTLLKHGKQVRGIVRDHAVGRDERRNPHQASGVQNVAHPHVLGQHAFVEALHHAGPLHSCIKVDQQSRDARHIGLRPDYRTPNSRKLS